MDQNSEGVSGVNGIKASMSEKTEEFPGQREGEKALLIIHRHWAGFLPTLALIGAMAALPAIVILILTFQGQNLLTAEFFPWVLFGSSAYLLFVIAFFLIAWMDYYLDMAVITDKRVLDINQLALFSRRIYELDLLHIEDVSARVKGWWPTMMGFGDVEIETAGTAHNVALEQIPQPYEVSRLILEQYEKALHQSPGQREIDQAEGLGVRLRQVR